MNREELLKNAKPILLNTEMVKAVLDGRKTQTRRVIKVDPIMFDNPKVLSPDSCVKFDFSTGGCQNHSAPANFINSSYTVGDVLWVRETFKPFSNIGMEDELVGVTYRADNKSVMYYNKDRKEYVFYEKWKPSIHMPKKYARIFLKVTDVRVERLWDISNEDAIKEGVEKIGNTLSDVFYKNYSENQSGFNDPIVSFASLWNSTAKEPFKWDDNPYVFVYEFERVET